MRELGDYMRKQAAYMREHGKYMRCMFRRVRVGGRSGGWTVECPHFSVIETS